MMYYFKYYVKDQVFPGFGMVGWEKLAAIYMTMWLATNIIGVLIAKPLASKIGKKQTFILAMMLAAFTSIFLLI